MDSIRNLSADILQKLEARLVPLAPRGVTVSVSTFDKPRDSSLLDHSVASLEGHHLLEAIEGCEEVDMDRKRDREIILASNGESQVVVEANAKKVKFSEDGDEDAVISLNSSSNTSQHIAPIQNDTLLGVGNNSSRSSTDALAAADAGSNLNMGIVTVTTRPPNQLDIKNFFKPNSARHRESMTTTAGPSPEAKLQLTNQDANPLPAVIRSDAFNNGTAKKAGIKKVANPNNAETPEEKHQSKEAGKEMKQKLNQAKDRCQNLELQVLKLTKELNDLKAAREMDLNLLEGQKRELDRTNEHFRQEVQRNSSLKDRSFYVIAELLREHDEQEFMEERKQAACKAYDLGRIVTHKSKISANSRNPHQQAPKSTDVWENGNKFEDLKYKQALLFEKRERIERDKKDIAKQKAKLKRFGNTAIISTGENSNSGNSGMGLTDEQYDQVVHQELEIFEHEESLKVRLSNLKRDELKLLDEKEDLRREKLSYMRMLKNINFQQRSRFNDRRVLNSRYLMRKLLGKGGFSEVWKAFDLVELRDVALKVHETDSAWSDGQKELYLKHAAREYKIHLALKHPRIVQLYDVFELDAEKYSFATVLEYCEGDSDGSTDLDIKLKMMKTFPEKEARAILIQIVAGLRYLNTGELSNLDQEGENDSTESQEPTTRVNRIGSNTKGTSDKKEKQSPSIIHYDLKPANILFDTLGNVKISDFGLSKIMYRSGSDDSVGIELTSQFAGTYWYLPPECFYTPNGVEVLQEAEDSHENHQDNGQLQRSGTEERTVHEPKTFGADERGKVKISSKVDVWSVGVIYFQMLYGKRPFGEGMSQQNILQSQTMLKATNVVFPEKPAISADAKKFIQKCLTYQQQFRPDVITLCRDPYLRQKKL